MACWVGLYIVFSKESGSISSFFDQKDWTSSYPGILWIKSLCLIIFRSIPRKCCIHKYIKVIMSGSELINWNSPVLLEPSAQYKQIPTRNWGWFLYLSNKTSASFEATNSRFIRRFLFDKVDFILPLFCLSFILEFKKFSSSFVSSKYSNHPDNRLLETGICSCISL